MTFADEARSSPIKFFFPIPSLQPVSAVGVIGGQAIFTAAFTSTNPALVTFLWQIQNDGATWRDLVETAGYYEGVATTTLTVKAIDNFLATRTSCNFRCRALFANAVPSFTNAAALSIPIHTDFRIEIGSQLRAQFVGGTVSLGYNPGVVVTGFAGPYTYLWTYVSGDNTWTPGGTTTASLGFFNFNVQPGWAVSYWKCTITSGLNSVVTDPIPFAIFGKAIGGGTTFLSDTTSPLVSDNGAQLDATILGRTYFAPWTIALQSNLRCLGVANAAAVTPAAASTTFTLAGSASLGGGTGVLVYAGVTMQVIATGTDYWETLGITEWLK